MSTNFGENLKNIRTDLEITQDDLCQKLGIDRSYLSKIENGKINPTLDTILKIASALNISPNDLIVNTLPKIKTVGILGGLGPDTTAEFYISIIQSFQKKKTETRPPIVITSVPLPLKTEKKFILHNKDAGDYLPFLLKEAKRLERSGVDFIVMPCNSLHIFIEELRSAVKIPVLSIIEEFVSFLKEKKIKEIGVISTAATLHHQLYEKALQKASIKFSTPDSLQQAKFGKVIHNLVEGTQTSRDRDEIMNAIISFAENNVGTVALACTDLQLLLPQHPHVKIYDTMQVFADATVNYMSNE
jgi:aspartate racemase